MLRRLNGKVVQTWSRAIAGAGLAAYMASSPASAFRIELKDVAPDRIERQRAEAIGQLPLPGTPNVAQLAERLAEKGLTAGSPVFIRVFKAESELELWMQKGDRFELFATYPICHWSGTLGPKVSEGDKQAPEGVYTVSARQLHMVGRHPRSLNLGFPNVLDRQFQRTGSYILIHGGCGSVGCFAMTNPVIEEIFSLTQASIKNGQEYVHVHAFPFRMTEDKLRAYALSDWYEFWRNLKDVYDSFEQTKRVARVSVCEGRYWVDSGGPREVAAQGPLAVCGQPLAASLSNSEAESAPESSLSWLPKPMPLHRLSPSLALPSLRPSSLSLSLANPTSPATPAMMASRSQNPSPPVQARSAAAQLAAAQARPTTSGTPRRLRVLCKQALASCRKWVALQGAIQAARVTRAAQARPRTIGKL